MHLRVLDFAGNYFVSVTCKRSGIARSSSYRWKEKFNPRNPKNLEDCSRRPKKFDFSGPQSLLRK